ncbi:MAG: efflux RND transporter permease subunit [Alphaproteobacteria bacterium]
MSADQGQPEEKQKRGGILSLFTRHPTAANLLMLIMILCGMAGLSRLNTQFFPTFAVEYITIGVTWPGATAEDVDESIVSAVEPEVRFLDSVKNVQSTAFEGLGSVVIEYQQGSDMQQALSEVEQAMAQITTLPEDSEEPVIQRILVYETIARIVLSGDMSEVALKNWAKNLRDDLLDTGIERVETFGQRDEELVVEVSPERLRQLDMTLGEIANRIAGQSQDIPSGDLAGGERKIRALGLARDPDDLAEIELIAQQDGARVTLGQVATVERRFDADQPTGLRNGMPAIELHVQRPSSADALDTQAVLQGWLDEVRPTLPPTLNVEIHDVQADLIQQRIDLLVENGITGLVLVLFILFLFLNGRIAFWVAVGIPVSLAATMGVMYLTGQSINMLSLFGIIMAIGIVVDDAIVVGEEAETRHSAGDGALDASLGAARRMAAPVSASSLTTCASFLPLFLITGTIGDIIGGIPAVVVAVIIASLIECFLVLPAHLRHTLPGVEASRENPGPIARAQSRFDGRFKQFSNGPFRSFIQLAMRWRYVTLALAILSLTWAVGMMAGGRVGFTFFPTPESTRIIAQVEMVAGSSRTDTAFAVREMEKAFDVAVQELSAELPDGTPATEDGSPLAIMVFGRLGTTVSQGIGAQNTSQDLFGGLVIELAESDSRNIRTSDLVERFRERVPAIPGLLNTTIEAPAGGPPGKDVDVRVSGDSLEELKAASVEIQALLQRYPGVRNATDNLPYGTPELVLEVSDRGRALGFTTSELGRQMRDSLEGRIARRFADGDEEVLVRVQLPDSATDAGILEKLWLRAPGSGMEVPLSSIVTVSEKSGFARIPRENGARQVAITAEILGGTGINTDTIIENLERDGIREIASRHNVNITYKGKAEEQAETFAGMRLGGILGLSLIYLVLAWVFASYTRPLAVMLVIPFGFVGAVAGHYVLGYDVTILTMTALLGLSGIVVNDSIVLVTQVQKLMAKMSVMDAIVQGSVDRFRAVLLTSMTTISGLLPLMFETSLQAQFLIPMALTFVSGLAFATVLVLVVIPALLAMQEDLRKLIHAATGWKTFSDPAEQLDHHPAATAH